VEGLRDLSPDERFLKLAVAIGGMKDATERADIAQTAFGRSGNQLLPLLEDIAEKGFGKLRRRPRRRRAVHPEEVDDADAYDDALTRLKLQFQALALNVLPALSFALHHAEYAGGHRLRVLGRPRGGGAQHHARDLRATSTA
jgi:hypothetical protein